MKTSQNRQMVHSLVLEAAVKVLRRELATTPNATTRNQLEQIDVVASELRELAALPDLVEPERHPLYISGKVLAEAVLNDNYLNGYRRAAARTFLELARVRASEKTA